MAAYVIADIRRFLVRGGRVETLEGDWSPSRIILLKFPDMENALREYGSPEYQQLAALRQRASSAHKETHA